MVLTVHIMWEFNVVNSLLSGIWVMLPNRAGDVICNDCDVIYGRRLQPAMAMMSYMVRDLNL